MRNEIEVMKVFRVPPLGKLVVEVNKQRYQILSEITEENMRHFLLAAIGELIIFAGGYKNLVDAGVAPPVLTTSTPPNIAEAAVTPGATITSPSPEQEQAKFLASLEAQRDATSGSASPKAGRFTASEQGRVSSSNEKLSIVEQIDAILQQHIMADPSLKGRSIQLTQKPAGGVRIKIDEEYYDHPREIGDPKIEQLIKRALKEWESS